MRILSTVFIVIVCLIIGSGIYFFFHQTSTPPPLESTIDTTIHNTILSLQSVSKSTTETGATITWKTDKPATSRVIIHDSSGATITDTELQETPGTSHSIAISSLKPNTTYSYTLISTDADGNEATSKGELTTLATADKTAPTISAVNFSNVTESSAIITWITNEPATSQIKYGKTETYDSTTSLDKNLTTTHNVTLTKLDSGTTYNFSIISKDAAGNEATSASNQPFKTLTSIQVGPQVDKLAPPFTLKDLNNNEVKLSDFRGKIVIVNFWATWCGPCMEELPFFQAISDNETAGGFKILAINKQESKNKVLSELADKGYTFTFTILLDSTGEVNTLYNVDTLPTTFFIDAEGIIKKIQVGSFENQAAIEKILNPL